MFVVNIAHTTNFLNAKVIKAIKVQYSQKILE